MPQPKNPEINIRRYTKRIDEAYKRKPNIPVDWDVVDQLLEAGCNGIHVASYFGIHEETLYIRCQKEKGMGFAAYSAIKRAKGDSRLLGKQFSVALQGDKTMLVWLGKQRLEQQENPTKETAFDGGLAKMLDLFNDLAKSGITLEQVLDYTKRKKEEFAKENNDRKLQSKAT